MKTPRGWQAWPFYSQECQRDVATLLREGGSLTAYQANPKHGLGPTPGSWAWQLERLAEDVHDVWHVIACANGTVGLVALLKATRFPGSFLHVPALTFSATVSAILAAGCRPGFRDVRLPSCTVAPGFGVLSVDLFGAPSGATCLVDACQSVGVKPTARHGVWSFNGRKNVPAGEAGAVFTESDDVAQEVRAYLGHGENFGLKIGLNGNLNELTACVAYHGLLDVSSRNRRRQDLARLLNSILSVSDRLTLPNPTDHAFYVYPLIVDTGMKALADRLQAEGISCQRGYLQPPLHHYAAFAEIPRGDLRITESLSQDRLLLFPQVTPTTTDQEIEQLGKKILQALR